MNTNRTLRYSLLIWLVLVSNVLLAKGKDWAERSKEINKSYTVSAQPLLSIDNSFGRVEVQEWNQNKVEVFVEIKVETRYDDRADDLLDRIMIDIADDTPSRGLRIRSRLC